MLKHLFTEAQEMKFEWSESKCEDEGNVRIGGRSRKSLSSSWVKSRRCLSSDSRTILRDAIVNRSTWRFEETTKSDEISRPPTARQPPYFMMFSFHSSRFKTPKKQQRKIHCKTLERNLFSSILYSNDGREDVSSALNYSQFRMH